MTFQTLWRDSKPLVANNWVEGVLHAAIYQRLWAWPGFEDVDEVIRADDRRGCVVVSLRADILWLEIESEDADEREVQAWVDDVSAFIEKHPFYPGRPAHPAPGSGPYRHPIKMLRLGG